MTKKIRIMEDTTFAHTRKTFVFIQPLRELVKMEDESTVFGQEYLFFSDGTRLPTTTLDVLKPFNGEIR